MQKAVSLDAENVLMFQYKMTTRCCLIVVIYHPRRISLKITGVVGAPAVCDKD